TPSVSATKAISAVLAAPSTGGAVRRMRSAPNSVKPSSALRSARGTTRTAIRTAPSAPESCSSCVVTSDEVDGLGDNFGLVAVRRGDEGEVVAVEVARPDDFRQAAQFVLARFPARPHEGVVDEARPDFLPRAWLEEFDTVQSLAAVNHRDPAVAAIHH